MNNSHKTKNLHVLHLPITIRWIMEAMIDGQHELGIETKKFLVSKRGVDNPEDETFHYLIPRNPKLPFKGYPVYLKQVLRHFRAYFRLLRWADVVHWQYSQRAWLNYGLFKNLDFWLLKALRKPVIGHFHGMDFLNNEEWAKYNPWWLESFDPPQMAEFNELAETTQRDFSKAGFHFATGFGMFPSVKKQNLDNASVMERTVDLSLIPKREDFTPNKVLRIVHGPSTPQKKGTPYVLKAIEEIKKERDIEFELLVNMTRDDVLKAMRTADIAIDQMLCGDYGVFSVEAMASGAAVVCNVCDELIDSYPEDLPIASANPLNLKEVLLRLIDDAEERIGRAKAGRDYAYKVHSIEETAPEILRVYRKAALNKGRRDVVEKIDHHLRIADEKGWKGISAGKEDEEIPKVWRLTHE